MTSKIKVDNISDQNDNNIINESGDVITVGAAGDTVAVAGNIVKSNAYQASDGGSIISQSGTTITIGASGDTVSLASGASQSGFGRSGSVNWQTTKKTASFTAVSGEGYFIDTTGGAITMTLPASPSAGDIVAVKDYDSTFATNNLTINRNSQPINGGSAVNPVINTAGSSIVLIYVDATQGWVPTQDDTSSIVGEDFVAASGGTITTDGNFKVHTFTGPGTFTVNCASSAAGNNIVSYLVVAGGGGAGGDSGGGGGAGGFREFKSTSAGCYTASPRDGNPGGTSITVSAQGYPITIGGGGGGGSGGNGSNASRGSVGSNSVFSTVTSTGGGGGGTHPSGSGGQNGMPGGSGGAGRGSGGSVGGTGNTPPVSPVQGTNGGPGGNEGGGALATGPGGQATSGISGSATNYSGGSVPSGIGRGGTKEGDNVAGGPGSGGTVIIRYRFQ